MSASAKLLPLLAMAAMAATAAEGLRNPFWPKGYVGEMTPISAEARPKPKPKPPAPKVDPKIEAAKAAGIADITVVTGHSRRQLQPVLARMGAARAKRFFGIKK